MSWKELKKINSDMSKSLDVLINEKFQNTDNSKDLTYIKNNQLGTSTNVFLGSATVSTQTLQNRTLVEKINYLLTLVSKIVYVSSTTKLITTVSCSSYRENDRVYVGYFYPQIDGTIYINCSEKCTIYVYSTSGNHNIYSNFTSGYLSVVPGKNLRFEAPNRNVTARICADIGYAIK